jgi:hypothetical protein
MSCLLCVARSGVSLDIMGKTKTLTSENQIATSVTVVPAVATFSDSCAGSRYLQCQLCRQSLPSVSVVPAVAGRTRPLNINRNAQV